MRRGRWLSSMAARVFVLLLVGVTAAAVLAFTLADAQRRGAETRAREQRLADRAVDLASVLDRAPSALRPALLGRGPEAARAPPDGAAPGAPDRALADRLASRLGAAAAAQAWVPAPSACRAAGPPSPREGGAEPREPPPPPPPPRAAPAPPAPDCRLIAFTLSDGERLRLLLPAGPRPPRERLAPLGPVMLAVLAAAAAILAFLTARVATAPLARLSAAAGDLGRDLDRPPLRIEGPLEVRRAAAAFNAMQTDLKRRQAERTYMLAAITHDLQTPLTRLRLRLEKVSDPALRDQLLLDQAAMMLMVRDGLDLARMAEGEGEAVRPLDVDSLLDSLGADAVEAGWPVAVTGRCGRTIRTRPLALQRCLSNLLDNAVKYAGSAELEASVEGGAVVLRVLDRGPGASTEELGRMFEPFVRLESSRSRETGGVGLGLTIARLLAERAGGSLTLGPRPGGGLAASVTLPMS